MRAADLPPGDALGEYDTPTGAQSVRSTEPASTGIRGRRFLDPACGSGTFLILAIERVRQWLANLLRGGGTNGKRREAVNLIRHHIEGFDLNPACGDRRPHEILGTTLSVPAFQGLLAGACLKRGATEEGLTTIAEALARRRDRSPSLDPKFHRLGATGKRYRPFLQSSDSSRPTTVLRSRPGQSRGRVSRCGGVMASPREGLQGGTPGKPPR